MKNQNLLILLLILILPAFVILTDPSSFLVRFNPTLAQQEDNLNIQEEFLYVGNAMSNSVSVIDLEANKVIKNITVGNGTHDIKISDDQQTVYTTDIDSGTVSIINTTSNMLMDQIDTNVAVHGIAVFQDNLYVGDVYGGKVLVKGIFQLSLMCHERSDSQIRLPHLIHPYQLQLKVMRATTLLQVNPLLSHLVTIDLVRYDPPENGGQKNVPIQIGP